MRKTYRALGYALVVAVVVQAMAVAYGMAGLGKWVAQDGGVFNQQVAESHSADFAGTEGFMIHALNGMMVIPLLTLLLLIVSFFAKIPGGSKRAAILVGLVVLQVVMGIALHSVPFIGALHALNAFLILAVAFTSARRAGDPVMAAPVGTRVGASV